MQWIHAKDEDVDDTEASVTIGPFAHQIRVGKVLGSYQATPTGDTKLSFAWTANGNAETMSTWLNVVGPIPLDFENLVVGDPGTAVVVTMTASGEAGNLSNLNVSYRLGS